MPARIRFGVHQWCCRTRTFGCAAGSGSSTVPARRLTTIVVAVVVVVVVVVVGLARSGGIGSRGSHSDHDHDHDHDHDNRGGTPGLAYFSETTSRRPNACSKRGPIRRGRHPTNPGTNSRASRFVS
jgi:hypothetical protein